MAVFLVLAAACSAGSPGSPSKPATTILTCSTISTPGTYLIGADLPTNVGCLTVSQVSGVQLDCQNHQVPGVPMNNVNNVTVANCVMTAPLYMNGVTGVTVSNSTTTGVQILSSSSVSVTNTTLGGIIDGGQVGYFFVTGGTNVVFKQDTFLGGLNGITFQGGMNNQVLQSSLTGGYGGGTDQQGADDGVVLQNESGDTVTGNTISNFYDAAVEMAGTVTNSTVTNNQISNIGTAAVGSYWCTNWSGNQIRGNTVSMAPLLALIDYQVGGASQCGNSISAPGLVNTQFSGNTFASPIVGLDGAGPRGRMQVHMSGTVQGNVLSNNNFGANDGPFLTPLTGFADGGGNVCGPMDPTLSNFACTGGTSSSTSRRRLATGPGHR